MTRDSACDSVSEDLGSSLSKNAVQISHATRMMMMRVGWTRLVDNQVLVAGCLLVSVGLLLRAKVYEDWPRIVEGGLYIGCLLLLAACKPLRQLFGAIPTLQRRFLFCLVALMLVSQMWSSPQKTFPFIPWAMYTRRLPEPPTFFEYVGICEDGREIEIPVVRVFRSQHRTVAFRLHGRWRKMQSAEDEATRDHLRQRYETLLMAMVKRFNQKHPETTVQKVRVVRCTMPRPSPGRQLEVTRQPFREYVVQ